MSPWTDLELVGETMTTATGDPPTIEASPRSMELQYLNGQDDPQGPVRSAIHANLSGLPPSHIEAGARDVLYSVSVRVVELLRSVGNDVRFESVPGAIHSIRPWLDRHRRPRTASHAWPHS